MVWVELVPLGLILGLAGWIFLRPFPVDKTEGGPTRPEAPDEDADR